jgi:hypothetical protein
MKNLILFFVLLLVIGYFPELLNKFYENVFGRIVMLSVLLYVAHSNLYLAIILLIISLWSLENIANPFPYLENFETGTSTEAKDGVDLETIKQSVQPKPSNSINVKKSISTTEVAPSESFTLKKK